MRKSITLFLAILIVLMSGVGTGEAFAASANVESGVTPTREYTVGDYKYRLSNADQYEIKSYTPFQSPEQDVLIGEDGRLYVTDYISLTAFSSDGAKLWSYTFDDYASRYIAMSPNGKSAPRPYKPAVVYLFDSDTGQKTKQYKLDSKIITSEYVKDSFAIDNGGNLYIDSNEGFASFDTNGKLRWANEDISLVEPAKDLDYLKSGLFNVFITSNNLIVAANYETNKIYGIDFSGNQVWQNTISIYGRDPVSPDRRYYLDLTGSLDGKLIDTQTGQAKEVSAATDPAIMQLFIANDGAGNYYVSKDGFISQMTATGKVNWSFEYDSLYAYAHAPFTDSLGNVYVFDENQNIYSFNSKGKLRYRLSMENSYWSTNLAYVNDRGDLIFFDHGMVILGAIDDNFNVEACRSNPAQYLPAKASYIRVFVDCREMRLETAPKLINGSVLVPMRSLFEAFGAKVDWDSELKTVTAVTGNTTVLLQIGSSTAYAGDQEVSLPTPPQLIGGKTYIPLRFVSEAFGYSVEWVKDKQAVAIKTG